MPHRWVTEATHSIITSRQRVEASGFRRLDLAHWIDYEGEDQSPVLFFLFTGF